MDINTLRGLSTIIIMIAFAGVVWWAYGKKRRDRFDQAANLPFDDEPQNDKTLNQNGHGDNQQ